MPDLFRAEEHEPLLEADWEEERARAAIRSIVADAESAFDGALWPPHPRAGEAVRTSVHMDAAGVWALHGLVAAGPVAETNEPMWGTPGHLPPPRRCSRRPDEAAAVAAHSSSS